MKTASFGSISSGTMRTEDLISTFSEELAGLVEGDEYKDLLAECEAWLEYDEDQDEDDDNAVEHDEQGDWLLEDLFDALNEASPAYGYFGAHEGDGACYGWWLSGLEDFDGLKVSDTSDVPEDYSGEVLHVNDHGNMTLYAKDAGKAGMREIWSLV